MLQRKHTSQSERHSVETEEQGEAKLQGWTGMCTSDHEHERLPALTEDQTEARLLYI